MTKNKQKASGPKDLQVFGPSRTHINLDLYRVEDSPFFRNNQRRAWTEDKDFAHKIAANDYLIEALQEWATWIDTLPGGLEQFETWARKQDNWADTPVLRKTRAALDKAAGK